METTECKWCGITTDRLGTKMCDRCWELDHRIRTSIDLAKKIIAHYDQTKEKNNDHS